MKNQIKSIALASLIIMSFAAYCFLNIESQKQETSQQTNLISVPVQETDVPALPDVKILYFIIDQVKGGLVPGK